MSYNCSTIRADGSSCFGTLNGCNTDNDCYPCDTNNDGGPYNDCNGMVSDIRKTRGVPGMGSTSRGPRGQELAFRNFSASRGTQPWRRFDGGRSNMMDKSASQYIMGLLGVGILFFVIGYGYEEGKKAA